MDTTSPTLESRDVVPTNGAYGKKPGQRHSTITYIVSAGGVQQLLPASAKRVAFTIGTDTSAGVFYGPLPTPLSQNGFVVNSSFTTYHWDVERDGTVVKAPWWFRVAAGTVISLVEIMED